MKIKKEEFQLVGLASMVLAAKTEEIYTPKLEDWAKSADDGYSLQEIKWMERSLLRSLNWQLFPVTSCTWLHWLMTQWDEFVTYHYGCVQFNNPQDFATFPKAVRRQFKQELNHRFIVFRNHYIGERLVNLFEVDPLIISSDSEAEKENDHFQISSVWEGQ